MTTAEMWAARLHGTGDIRLAREPVPAAAPGQSLVRVTAVGLCGSDLHWWDEAGIGDARLDRPLVLGHENAGVIAAGPRGGQRVAIDPAIPDGTCASCLRGDRNLCPQVRFAGHGGTDGGLREYLVWPTELLHPLPDALSDADGALLEPLGVAAHAVDLGHLRLGGSAAVIGCGPIGLMIIQLLRVAGVSRVLAADPLPHRAEAAAGFGAAAIAGSPAGADVDTAFEVAGTDAAVDAAMAAARPGGRIVLAGIPDHDRTSFRASVARRKGLTIAMSRRMNEAYPRAIALAGSGRVDLASLVTGRAALAQTAAAFRGAARREGLKVIVEPASRA
ncbi:MAG TPA: alcohol dehydrogenase catalytic domain-containing protein [Streptosporangiaceae bacterium]|nr:alcohol dehydrogenase catalytic domain-containing protein [Streptosporangiaceae bacterium]